MGILNKFMIAIGLIVTVLWCSVEYSIADTLNDYNTKPLCEASTLVLNRQYESNNKCNNDTQDDKSEKDTWLDTLTYTLFWIAVLCFLIVSTIMFIVLLTQN